MSRNLLNILGFQIVWFACVLTAAQGNSWIGLIVFAAVVAAHVWFSSPQAKEAGLLILAGCIGLLAETILLATGATAFGPGDELPPVWMIALWVNFATTLRHSLKWLQGKPALAAALGAIAGPLSYLGGERLGAIRVANPWAVAIEWAAATPFLFWIAGRIR